MINQIDKLLKGNVTKAHDTIDATATSKPIDCRGYNSIMVQAILSATQNWTFKLQGSMNEQGTYTDLYEQANSGSMVAMSYQTNASKMFLFKGIPDWVKVVATEDVTGATATVYVQPLNV